VLRTPDSQHLPILSKWELGVGEARNGGGSANRGILWELPFEMGGGSASRSGSVFGAVLAPLSWGLPLEGEFCLQPPPELGVGSAECTSVLGASLQRGASYTLEEPTAIRVKPLEVNGRLLRPACGRIVAFAFLVANLHNRDILYERCGATPFCALQRLAAGFNRCDLNVP
jgi:hypothetical protein